jgi:hypothetical protein
MTYCTTLAYTSRRASGSSKRSTVEAIVLSDSFKKSLMLRKACSSLKTISYIALSIVASYIYC